MFGRSMESQGFDLQDQGFLADSTGHRRQPLILVIARLDSLSIWQVDACEGLAESAERSRSMNH